MLCALAMPSLAQLNIGTVDAGPYTPGSTIAATFTIDANSCIEQNNNFELWLSDASGNFTSETRIGTFIGFYSTFVNGLIPAGTPLGTGYRVRVKSTNPANVSSPSSAFEIKGGFAIEAKLNSTSQLANPNPEVFGLCNGVLNNQFFLTNESTATSTVTSTITNELSGVSSALNFTTANQTFSAQLAHYTIFTKAVMPDATVATKAYQLINNVVNTPFGTSGNNVVCLPMGFLEFNVIVDGSAGIRQNYPGNIYRIDWGDGAVTTHTICDIIQNNEKVRHTYIKSSCGAIGTGGVFNAFNVIIRTTNPYCGDIGTAVSSTAKVVVKPRNSFSFPPNACTNTRISFSNTSILGEDPDSNTPGCKDNNVLYNWFVDGVPIEVGKPRDFVFEYVFTTNGKHTVKLTSSTTGTCPADDVEQEICLQNAPIPQFSFNQNTVCGPVTLKPSNTSIIDPTCNTGNSYFWTVTPSVSFANGTNASSTEPEFNFTPGVYQVILSVTTPSCGTILSAPQTIVVNATPTATLSPDITLCNLATYDFNNTTLGSTRTILEGTSLNLSDTYTWTVSGPGAYNFTDGTNLNSKYPKIQFLNYAEYTITVVHKNNCGTATATQKITFTAAPEVKAGLDQTICFNETTVALNGSINGSTLTQAWVGGNGTFTPSRNDLNATYAPTFAEKQSGSVTLTLRATTALPSPCNDIPDDIIIYIKPLVTLNSPSAKTICTGQSVDYIPTSATAGTTYTWTATGSANASGFSATGSGSINDVLSNTDPIINATVTYVIIPVGDGCTGEPFTLIVTVTPNPVLIASATNTTICSGQNAAIALSSNLTGTRYTWTSTKSLGITGNSSSTSPILTTEINDVLVNSATTPGTVTYTITPISANGCLGTPVVISIDVNPQPTLPNAGLDESICNATSFTFKGNPVIVGTGLWTQVSNFSDVTINDANQHNATAFGLIPGNTYIFRWTITGANGCNANSDEVAIIVNPLSEGGITSGSTQVCTGSSNGQITLTGHVGNVIRWESSTDGITYPTVINNNTNTLTYTNLTTTTYYRAVVQSGICAPVFSTPSVITVNAGTTVANAGVDQILCNESSTTLAGNSPGSNTGLWTVTPANPSVIFADATQFNTAVSGLVGGQIYTFRWTITGLAPCAPSSDEVIVNNLSALLNNTITTTSTTNCTGQAITLTGGTPTGGNNTYTYIWQSSTTGAAPWITIAGQTNPNLNVTVNTSQSYRRIANSGVCSSISNVINITALPPIANNTITGNQTICLTNTPNPILGSQPTGGDGSNYAYSWEQSINNGVTWAVIPNEFAANYTPQAIVQSTLYRRLVSSGICSGSSQSISNVLTINVNLNAKAEFTYVNDVGCIPYSLDADNIKAIAYPMRNATYNWYANNVLIGTGITFPGYTITTDNTNVTIKLVATSSLGCLSDEMSHTFSTRQNITASFSQTTTSGCGPLSVSFNNTTTALTGVTFEWSIDNNIISTATNPGPLVFLADPAGEDKIYTVVLRATTPCGSTTASSTVTVKPNPIAAFLPNKTIGCSPLTVVFTNTSPGSSTVYSYDFDDGTTSPATTNKGIVTHTFTTDVVRDYEVKMTATNECGTDTKAVIIRVSPNTITPALIVNGNQMRGCAPFTVNFINNTKGASKFTYTFEPGVIVTSNTFSTETRPYTFNRPGTYVVNLLAENGCSTASAEVTVVVDPQPTVAFTAANITGCQGLSVKFTNTSTDAVSYTWNFGDGKTSNEVNPTHIYNSPPGLYTVSLTAVNALGCPTTFAIQNYIRVVPPPTADFNVAPASVISIPEYTFKFTDASVNGAQTYKWSFGDGSESNAKDPTHKYADTGKYQVTMRTYNEFGCVDSLQKTVQIIGVPGYVYLPNSFIPGGTSSPLQKFTALGSGIKKWRMQIFNKWGQVVFETTQLNDGKPVEGWDGSYKGVPQPQGIYFWKLDVELINGTEWKGMTYDNKAPKRTGEIYLIR
jgi:PKD repeat protein